MIKEIKPSTRFIKLLMDGKFKKPTFIKMQQIGFNKGYSMIQNENDLENYKFFINSSCYDEIEKVKVKKYNGDNF